MAYTVIDLRNSVRAYLQNIAASSFPDVKLDEALLAARRRLDSDRPNELAENLAGSGKRTYRLDTSLTSWLIGFSTIRSAINITPDLAADEEWQWLDPGAYRLVRIAGAQEWIQFNDPVSTGETSTIVYTAMWKLSGLDSAATTTITDTVKNALVYASVAQACWSLSVKHAGHLSSEIPGDMINWRTMSDEYGKTAQSFMKLYMQELKLDGDKVKPVFMRANFTPAGTGDRLPYLTHRNS